MKIYTIEQFKTIQQNQNYKYIGLFNQQGQGLIPFNTNKTTPAQRLREIETRLMSEALPDGYYFIKCKNSVYKSTPSDDYAIFKGQQLSENKTQVIAPVQIVEKPAFQPEVLTYEGALKLQVELEKLKLENANLKEKINELEIAIEDKTVLSEEAQPSMMENAKNWLVEILSIGAPLLDKHFALKEQALQLKAYELKTLQNRPAQPMQKPENNFRPEAEKGKIENIIMTFQERTLSML